MNLFSDLKADLDPDVQLENLHVISQAISTATPPLDVEIRLSERLTAIEAICIRIDDLRGLSEHLVSHGTISQESAQLIETMRPGFFHSRRVIGQFTKEPSRAFLAEGTSYVSQQLALETAALNAAEAEMLEETVGELRMLADYYEKRYKPTLELMVRDIKTTYRALLAAYSDSHDLVVMAGNSSMALLDTPLAVIAAADVHSDRAAHLVPAFLAATNAVLEVLKSYQLQQHLQELSGCERMALERDELTYRLLLDIYAGERITMILDEQHLQLCDCVEQFIKFKDQAAGHDMSTEGGEEFLRQNVATIRNFNETVLYVKATVSNMTLLNVAIKPALTYLNHLL